jgi:serine/threonine protein kinase
VKRLPLTGRGHAAIVERFDRSQYILKRVLVTKSELDSIKRLRQLQSPGVDIGVLQPTVALNEAGLTDANERQFVDLMIQYIPGVKEITSRVGSNVNKTAESNLKRWLYRVLESLAFLHRNKIQHNGIKPSNVVVEQNDEIHVLDPIWGSLDPSVLPLDAHGVSSLGLYRPPDWINAPQPDKVDIWAVGMLFFQLIAPTNIEKVRSMCYQKKLT